MKKCIYYCASVVIIFACVLSICSCSNDDDNGPSGISRVYGAWICISSTDYNGSENYKNLFVGQILIINADNTYSSTSSDFGKTGTWSVSGNTFVARTSTGKSINATFTVNSSTLKLSGRASNGFNFNYTFEKY